MGRTHRSVVAAVLVAGVVITGCGGDDPTPADRDARGSGATSSTSAPPPTTAASTDSAPTDSAPTDSAPTDATAPAPSALVGCERLGESPDGVYRFEAGQVAVARTGDRLVLGDVVPAAGWAHVVDDLDDDDIEIDFRRGSDGRHLEFEADLDDGILDVEVCVDR